MIDDSKGATDLREALQRKSLTTRQAAAYLGLSPNTLSRWRWSGDGPTFHKFGRAVRYLRDDLDAWIATTARANTTEAQCG